MDLQASVEKNRMFVVCFGSEISRMCAQKSNRGRFAQKHHSAIFGCCLRAHTYHIHAQSTTVSVSRIESTLPCSPSQALSTHDSLDQHRSRACGCGCGQVREHEEGKISCQARGAVPDSWYLCSLIGLYVYRGERSEPEGNFADLRPKCLDLAHLLAPGNVAPISGFRVFAPRSGKFCILTDHGAPRRLCGVADGRGSGAKFCS